MPKSIKLAKLDSPDGKVELTIIQQEIFDFVWNKSVWRPPKPPTMAKIAEHLGVKSGGTIVPQLRLIQRKGWGLPEWDKRRRSKNKIVP